MPRTLGLEKFFDDIIAETKIVINESLKNLYHQPVDVGKVLGENSSIGFHKLIITLSGPGGEGELKLYRYNDLVLATIYKGSEGKIYGEEALRLLEDEKHSIVRIQVYEIPEDIIAEIIGKDKVEEIKKGTMKPVETRLPVKEEKKEEEEKPETPREKPVEAVEKPPKPPSETSSEAVRSEVWRLISDFGLEILNLRFDEAEDNVKIFIDLAPTPTWIDPKNVLPAVVYKYVSLRNKYPVIKIELRHGDTHETLLLIKPEEIMATATIGKILQTLIDNGIPVTGTDYNVDKESMKLTIRIKAKKPIYPGVSVEEVLEKAYEEAKQYWTGNLEVRVKTGRFREVKIPK